MIPFTMGDSSKQIIGIFVPHCTIKSFLTQLRYTLVLYIDILFNKIYDGFNFAQYIISYKGTSMNSKKQQFLAGLHAWKKCPVMLCVLAAIAADFILYLVI